MCYFFMLCFRNTHWNALVVVAIAFNNNCCCSIYHKITCMGSGEKQIYLAHHPMMERLTWITIFTLLLVYIQFTIVVYYTLGNINCRDKNSNTFLNTIYWFLHSFVICKALNNEIRRRCTAKSTNNYFLPGFFLIESVVFQPIWFSGLFLTLLI